MFPCLSDSNYVLIIKDKAFNHKSLIASIKIFTVIRSDHGNTPVLG